MASSAYSKAKGRKAEKDCVEWFEDSHGFVAKRIRLAGSKDEGDLIVAQLPDVCWEVKHQATDCSQKWLRELEKERENSSSPYGVLVRRPAGVTNPGMWHATMYLRDMVEVFKDLKKAHR